MRQVLFLLLSLAAAVPGLGAPATTMDPHEVLKAIDQFALDPTNVAGYDARAVIFNFADKSPLVRVSLSKDLLPWADLTKGAHSDAPDIDWRNVLVIAYIAGNVRSQLELGHPKDDPYSGWIQVIATYAQLRKLNPEVKISEVEDLQKDVTQNKLHDRADKALARELEEEAKAAKDKPQ